MAEAFLIGILFLDLGLLFATVEQMVKSSNPEDLVNDTLPESNGKDDWEYKIVQVRGGGFRSLKAIQYVCQQEAKFGWVLLEKIDDNRLRLKRSVSWRAKDSLLKQNPYRTDYGVSGDFMVFLSIVATLMILVIPAYLGYSFMRRVFDDLEVQTPSQTQLPKPKQR
jgi:hypothetical protein